MCPFHNWTYANDGTLVGVPREADFGSVDKSCHGLIELPAQERHGTSVACSRKGSASSQRQLKNLNVERTENGARWHLAVR